MIYEALDPASPRPALIRRLRRDAPCLRAYARSLGVGLEDLAVDDVFIRVVPPVILAPAFVAFLESADGDGAPRFGAGTRRVYRSHASRLARAVVRARRAVLGESDELWTGLLDVLRSKDDPPLYRDRNAWALWVFRCRAREVDPYRPPDPATAIEDYEAYVAAWGYTASTVASYRARVVHLLRLLHVVDAAVLDVSLYEREIEELVGLVMRKWQSKRFRPLRPASQTAQRYMLRHFARFVLASTTNGKEAPVMPDLATDHFARFASGKRTTRMILVPERITVTAAPDIGERPSLKTMLLDIGFIECFIRHIGGTSPSALAGTRTNLIRLVTVLGASPAHIEEIHRLINFALAEREEKHESRPMRLVESAPWPVLIRAWLTWDQHLHAFHAWGSEAWAWSTHDRAVLMTMLLTGMRKRNLIGATASGERPHFLFTADRATLRFHPHEVKNSRRLVVPAGKIPGFGDLLQVYMTVARPILLAGRTLDRLFFSRTRRPFDSHGFSRFFNRFRRPVFAGHPVYVHYMRNLAVVLLRDGFGVTERGIARMIGDTERTVTEVYYALNMQAAAGEWTEALGGVSRDRAVEQLVTDLKAWLRQLATDFGRGDTPSS
jgi:hypothetical protein